MHVPSCLTAYDIPNTISTIESNSFIYSNIQHLVIPAHVVHIKIQSFYFAYITNITIVGNPKIDSSLFLGCDKLKTIFYLGQKPYKKATNLTNVQVYTCIGYRSNTFGDINVQPRTDCLVNKEPRIRSCKKYQRRTSLYIISIIILISIK